MKNIMKKILCLFVKQVQDLKDRKILLILKKNKLKVKFSNEHNKETYLPHYHLWGDTEKYQEKEYPY